MGSDQPTVEIQEDGEAASNFPKYRRVYLWIMIAGLANFLVHWFVIQDQETAITSFLLTLLGQLALCFVLLIYLFARRAVDFVFGMNGRFVESGRIFLSGLFFAYIFFIYVGSFIQTRQSLERGQSGVGMFLLSVMILTTLICLLMAVFDAAFFKRVEKKLNPEK